MSTQMDPYLSESECSRMAGENLGPGSERSLLETCVDRCPGPR